MARMSRIMERGRSYKIIKCDSGCGRDWAVIMNVAWNNYEGGAWCPLNKVNLKKGSVL